MMEISDWDIGEVDGFFAEKKRLEDGIPLWLTSSWPGEKTATWNIVNDLNIVRGVLRFRLPIDRADCPSISVVFRQNLVYALHVTPAHIVKHNPIWARQYGLPPTVTGAHCHTWLDNRKIVKKTGSWSLPARREVKPQLRRLPQMVPWLAAEIGIESLTPDQYLFDIPPKTELF